MSSDDKAPLRLADRRALSIAEAAQMVGMSEGAFRSHLLPRCPKFYAGRSVRIPLRLFERFLEELATEEQQEQHGTAADLLTRTQQRSRKA